MGGINSGVKGDIKYILDHNVVELENEIHESYKLPSVIESYYDIMIRLCSQGNIKTTKENIINTLDTYLNSIDEIVTTNEEEDEDEDEDKDEDEEDKKEKEIDKIKAMKKIIHNKQMLKKRIKKEVIEKLEKNETFLQLN